VLFINDNLLLHASKHTLNLSTFCPSCQCEPKNTCHFLECTHQDRCLLFNNFKTQLTIMTKNIGLTHASSHLYGLAWLQAICHDTQYPDILMDILPEFHCMIQHQSWLGPIIPRTGIKRRGCMPLTNSTWHWPHLGNR